MIDDIIQKLLALPNLAFRPEADRAFRQHMIRLRMMHPEVTAHRFLQSVGCDLITSTTAPAPDKLGLLKTQSNAAYVVCGTQLFYINIEKNECQNLEITKENLKQLQAELKPAYTAKTLLDKELKRITALTGHTHNVIFSDDELTNIIAFLDQWPEIIKAADKQWEIINAACLLIKGKTAAGGSELLPLVIIALLNYSTDIVKLESLLDLILDFRPGDYHFAELWGASKYITEQNKLPEEKRDYAEYNEYFPLIEILRTYEGHHQIELLRKFYCIFVDKKSDLRAKILTELTTRNIPEFSILPKMNEDSLNVLIMNMHAACDKPPLTNFPELVNNVKKYLGYFDLEKTVTSFELTPFDRLRSLVMKLPLIEEFYALGSNLDAIIIDMPQDDRDYLDLHEEKKTYIYGMFFQTPPSNLISFRKVMEALSRKIEKLEASQVTAPLNPAKLVA